MMKLEIGAEEQEVLGQILQHALSDLDVEIHRTDKIEFKELLKHRRELLNEMLMKLQPAVALPT